MYASTEWLWPLCPFEMEQQPQKHKTKEKKRKIDASIGKMKMRKTKKTDNVQCVEESNDNK